MSCLTRSLFIGSARRISAGIVAILLLGSSFPASGYSVLTHEAIIDTLWLDTVIPLLKARFPDATDDQLKEAHAFAYGGCIIQDLGYYPFGSHLFSDIVHYVRSADFARALLDESQNLYEYAFALGALAHYGADTQGHSIAVNRAVPILFPRLRKRFGNDVTYADDPAAHLKTEFGFDVLQVARGHYASQAYHDFIGFQVSKDLLDRAFTKTYGLHLKDLFRTLDLSLGTYRYSVGTMVSKLTKTAWSIKSTEIEKNQPSTSRKQFLYNLKRSSFDKEWGKTYEHPGFGARFLALLFHLIPKIGPFQALAFKVPTPQTEKMFEDSFDASVNSDRQSFAQAKTGNLRIPNRDLDTGNPVRPGEYMLTDKTYDKLLTMLAKKDFADVTPALRADILGFYARMKTPDPHGVDTELGALKALPELGSAAQPAK